MNAELYQELIKNGLDEASARRIAEEQKDEGSKGGLPFEVLKINYDKEDILSEAGVKKGAVISKWKIDMQEFSVKEKGLVFDLPMDFVIIGVGYQLSTYSPQSGGYKYITPIFTDPYKSKSVRELKTGKTVEELKKAGETLKFNQILLVLVKEPGSDNIAPYLLYLRGVNYFEFNKQLKDRGIDSISKIVATSKISVTTKKIPTQAGIPAWIYEIQDIQKDVTYLSSVKIGEIYDKWNEWIKQSGEGGQENTSNAETAVSVSADNPATPEISDDEDLPF